MSNGHFTIVRFAVQLAATELSRSENYICHSKKNNFEKLRINNSEKLSLISTNLENNIKTKVIQRRITKRFCQLLQKGNS